MVMTDYGEKLETLTFFNPRSLPVGRAKKKKEAEAENKRKQKKGIII